MIVETATVWAMSALFLIMVVVAFYFAIFFLIWYIIGWPLSFFLRSIFKMLS